MNSDGKCNAWTGHPLAFWRSQFSVKRNALRMPVPNLSPCVRWGLRFVILIPGGSLSELRMGAFHLVKISGISGSAVNGTRFVGSSHWKIPRKSGKSKKVVPFSRLEFPNGMSSSIYVSRSLYQFQVHGRAPRHVPGFTTKWNNFLPIGNSTFATTQNFRVFFVNGKRPISNRLKM